MSNSNPLDTNVTINPDTGFAAWEPSAEDRAREAESMAAQATERSLQAGHEARGWGTLDIAEGLPMGNQSTKRNTPATTDGAGEVFLGNDGTVTLANGVQTSLDAAVSMGMVRKTIDGRHYDVSIAETKASMAEVSQSTQHVVPQEYAAPSLDSKTFAHQEALLGHIGETGYDSIIRNVISGGDTGQVLDSLAVDTGVNRGDLAQSVEQIHNGFINQAQRYIGSKFGNEVDFNAFVNWTDSRMGSGQRTAMMMKQAYAGDMSQYDNAVRAFVQDTANLLSQGVRPEWLR